ncbi:arylamine N-acetyltransferase [Sporosarcina thermotolerans]|uniref:Arylamine N-acetyltransferase n=1 Tax=Sporosarcina thermotolerans TaxID=633404 RepID=A0AAW9ACB0_9BACL|nr:arylamine N-acetyltransferase [Sporosarcina thermotolerans]MDW0117844.1 arylamine N-acetyltransferase [Sporosarcina thermotolerans]WHT49348.1 arylamine N-acetyltransferase [Sporosarcina thermotolerans]
MNIDKYLMRFNASHLTDPSLKNLKELQFLHMTNIPFENLDVIRKVPIYLNLITIYEKIVTRIRGGYCYELNGLFHWLLVELGYDASLVAATVFRPNGKWAKPETHAAILVHLDETYLVDVGFGDSTILPIPLNGDLCTDAGGSYDVKKFDNLMYVLNRTRNGESRMIYKFRATQKRLEDFHEGCVFNQVSADSTFTHVDIITRATETGRISLYDDELSIYEKGNKKNRVITHTEKPSVMKDLFGIEIK